MTSHAPYFRRGAFRLVIGISIVGISLIALNVIGYWLQVFDLSILGESSRMPESYLGRAALLAFVGWTHLVLAIGSVAVSAALSALGYFGILYLGGYRLP